ncbi:hypothetical protein VNTUMSATTG_59400 (plasmid) [Vibrio nigripulchritudo]|nr:hypothetical protein VNTUMSATTG_59400 [Vibrio nigripulchritudo]
MAFSPGNQASIFNASVKRLNPVQQERLVSLTRSLHDTLNAKESAALMGHKSLRIASYMFLVEFWQTYSLKKVLQERGITIDGGVISRAGLNLDLISTPLNLIGPLSIAVSTSECSSVKKSTFKFNYVDVLNEINKLQRLLKEYEYTSSAEASLVFLKAYFYQKLHSPNSTHTYANSKCISDINGLFTCADDLMKFGESHHQSESLARSYMLYDFKTFGLSEAKAEELERCRLTIWHYLSSAGAMEPSTDGGIIGASQVLTSNLSADILKAGEDTSFSEIAKGNQELIQVAYFPESIQLANGKDPRTMLKGMLIIQMQLAALRTAKLLSEDEALK